MKLSPSQSRTPFALLLAAALCSLAGAEDWPTYRRDIARSGVTPEKIAMPLAESWVYRPRHAPTPAWEPPRDVPVEGFLELPRIRFDDANHTVVAGSALYFGSSADNKVYCLDAGSGRVRWTFFTGGPVRLAPTVSEGRVYAGSDDGNVYCLAAADGKVIWQRRAGPDDRRLLGHGKMVSMWPVRTGVLVDNGVAYYGAGIFPAEGVYVEAARASDGQLLWRNDTGGESAEARMSPQGYLLATSTNLFVPQGRSAPSAFDRQNGRQVYEFSSPGGAGSKGKGPLFNASFANRGVGGTFAFLADNQLYTGTEQIVGYDSVTRLQEAWFAARKVIITESTAFLTTSNAMLALKRDVYPKVSVLRFNLRSRRTQMDAEAGNSRKEQKRLAAAVKQNKTALADFDAKLAALPAGDPKRATLEADQAEAKKTLEADEAKLSAADQKLDGVAKQLESMDKQLAEADAEMESSVKWRLSCDCSDALILAGDVLFAGGQNRVLAADAATGAKLWEAKVAGTAKGLTVSGGRLYVSTTTGAIYCFIPRKAGAPPAPSVISAKPNLSPYPPDKLTAAYAAAAKAIARESGVKRGFCLVLGCETGRLALELAKNTEMKIIGIEPDAQKVAAARKALDAAGLYGARVTVDQGALDCLPYASYFANLIVSDTALLGRLNDCSPKEVLRLLKPCGGVAMLGQPSEAKSGITALTPAALRSWFASGGVPGVQTAETGGVWATFKRGPLPGAGSWTHEYADAANTTCGDDKLVKCPLGLLWFGDPGPLQMVSRHRRAAAPLSVNGIMLVEGEHAVNGYDAYNGLKLWQRNIPNVIRTRVSDESSNLAADENSFYVATTNKCLRLDAATGALKVTFSMPRAADGKPRSWCHVAVANGLLIGTGSKTDIVSDILFACDTATGQIRWTYTGGSIQNATISIADGRVFFTDGGVQAAPSGKPAAKPGVRVVKTAKPATLRNITALDLATGRPVWRKQMDLTGCVGGSYWSTLGSMVDNGVLVLFGVYTDGHFWKEFFAGQFEKRGVVALAASDGSPLWSKNIPYRVRPLIIGDTFHAEPWAFDLKTGEQRTRVNPITGRTEPWQFARPGHHCGTPAACANVMFFRSYYLGYYDLLGDFGTATFGGQRPGCWINFIAANGLVMMPEASSGCMCPFPNMCTVVFAPREENRAWGKYSLSGDMKPVKHLAFNLGAPGDRRDAAGTLWLAYPRPAGAGSLVLQPKIAVKMLPAIGGYFAQSPDSVRVVGTTSPWLYTFGTRGVASCEIPLLDAGDGPGRYTIRLGFAEMDDAKAGARVFDVKLQGKEVLKDFDVVKEAGAPRKALVKEFKGVDVDEALLIEFVPKSPQATAEQAPILQTVEVLRERLLNVSVSVPPPLLLSNSKPEQTAKLQVFNQTSGDFAGTLRVVAPEGFTATPAELPVNLPLDQRAELSFRIAATKQAQPAKCNARIQLRRGDGAIESEREMSLEFMGKSDRVIFKPVADAYVIHSPLTANYGNAHVLLVDGGDKKMGDDRQQITYLRFAVNIPGRLISARLRIHNAGNLSTNGGNICLVTEPWSEGSVSYANHPKPGQVLANIGRVAANQTMEIPLRGLSLEGAKELSLAIDPVNCDGVNYFSRESNKPPELIVEFER
ncbi:MAG: PQQ-binding-like beta-propeller repeat protein [Verrucomicrobia bacterium]|nr:PQQ-binding-like beta-propeller repeat protein [Verrucomicrobiota bacterium]